MRVPSVTSAVVPGVLAIAILLLAALPLVTPAESMLQVSDLVGHSEAYDKRMVIVFGRVTNIQVAATRQGQMAYGFLLKDEDSTVKVIGLGKPSVREGDPVIVEGLFSRLRQAGRMIIYNEIKASRVRPLNRLNPDLVG